MMIDLKAISTKLGLKFDGVIQIGAHLFQEKQTLLEMGVKRFILFEPQRSIFEKLVDNAQGMDDCILYNCALSNKSGKMTMFTETVNGSQSSSLLKPLKHLEKYPTITFDSQEEVDVFTLDELGIDTKQYPLVLIDVQGAEKMVFEGAVKSLENVKAIYAEINFEELYTGCVLVGELDEFLSGFGFNRVATGENHNNQGWSDALYLK